MGRLRRFRVPALFGLKPGDSVQLPEEEIRHLHVLRLKSGDAVELFDDSRRGAEAILRHEAGRLSAQIVSLHEAPPQTGRLILAVAWPKGKRAATLVEKCAELGVDEIVPLDCERSVVSKESGSEGLGRLKRIAAEAAKQCRRCDVPQLRDEQKLENLLAALPADSAAVLMDPGAPRTFAEFLFEERAQLRQCSLLILVGPEGGFSPREAALAAGRTTPVRLAENILRIETAAIAACAIAHNVLDR